jgi:ABC-2 type transport system ATP-binding protein
MGATEDAAACRPARSDGPCFVVLEAQNALLAASGVSRRFGQIEVLHPCDLELLPGEALALVGPNGAGKSTLLSILAGALEPSSGEVTRGARVGWSPQRPALYGRLTPRENLELFARLEGDEAHVDELLAELELVGNVQAATLSVGMRQRLNLALGLLGSPRVLLLDEPTASLDAARRELLWQRVERLRAAGGAVCFATQNADELGRATRVVRIEEGRLAPA